MTQELVEHRTRLLGHRDGIITAMLKVKERIAAIRYRYGHTPKHHKRMLAKRDAMLQPLLELELWLEEERARNQDTYNRLLAGAPKG